MRPHSPFLWILPALAAAPVTASCVDETVQQGAPRDCAAFPEFPIEDPEHAKCLARAYGMEEGLSGLEARNLEGLGVWNVQNVLQGACDEPTPGHITGAIMQISEWTGELAGVGTYSAATSAECD